MVKGDKVLVEATVRQVLPSQVELGWDSVLAGTKQAVLVSTNIVTPAPLYQNGDEVEVRDHDKDDWQKSYYAAYIDGVHYCYSNGRKPGQYVSLMSWVFVRHLPTKVTVELDKDKHEAARMMTEHETFVNSATFNGYTAMDLLKAITEGAKS